MQYRLLFAFLSLIAMPLQAEAKVKAENYTDPSLADLTKFSSRFNLFDLKDVTTFNEYLKLTDCKAADLVKDSPFKQEQAQQIVLKSFASEQKSEKPLYLHIPITLQVSGYNFETQALPIMPDSQFKRVNMLELVPPRSPLCDRGNTGSITKISTYYMSKLDFPISLYRIPLQKNLAESIFNKLDRYSADYANVRFVYGYIMLELQPITPEISTNNITSKTIVRGQVNAINLYIDQERTILFKTLDYSENF